jgi:hypothetical protein
MGLEAFSVAASASYSKEALLVATDGAVNTETCSTKSTPVPPPAPKMRPAPEPLWLDPSEELPELELPEAADCGLAAFPPAAPPLRPSATPFIFQDIPEFALPESADTRSMPPTPRLRPASPPMDLDDMSEIQLPDAMDVDMEDSMPSMDLIFTLDGLSDCSSEADVGELSLKELFGCDEDEEPDALESPADVSLVSPNFYSTSASKLEAIQEFLEESSELKTSAPIKDFDSELGSPILSALLRASSSCSTRESTPSPKAVLGTKWRREVTAALHD